MKVFWVIMVLVVFGLGGMWYAQCYIRNSLADVLLSMETMETALCTENTMAAKKAYKESVEKYVHMLNRLTLFVHHNELSEVRAILGRLGVCIADEAWIDARASFAEAKIKLMTVVEQERLEIKNIF